MVFKTPIECLNTMVVKKLSPSVIDDMNLVNVYSEIIGSRESVIESNIFSTFSTNKQYLKDTSLFLKKCAKSTNSSNSKLLLSMNKKLSDFLSNTPTWKHDYKFITFDNFEHLNRNKGVQQIYSLLQIGTPVFNLALPILFTIFPFILIKFVLRQPVSLDLYLKLLKQQFYKKIFGKNFSGFASANMAYISFSIFFYFFNIYSSIISCRKYLSNFIKIREFIENLEIYGKNLLASLQYYISISREIISHRENGYVKQLENMINDVDNIISSIPMKPGSSLKFIWNIGNTMKEVYEWFSEKVSLLADFSRFHHYNIVVERIVELKSHLSRARFVEQGSREKMIKFVHPLLVVREKNPT